MSDEESSGVSQKWRVTPHVPPLSRVPDKRVSILQVKYLENRFLNRHGVFLENGAPTPRNLSNPLKFQKKEGYKVEVYTRVCMCIQRCINNKYRKQDQKRKIFSQ